MRLFIDCLYYIATPFFLPILCWKAITKKKYRKSIPGMFGRIYKDDCANTYERCVWVHAVSMGEVLSISSLLPALKAKFGDTPILLTTTTETGYNAAVKIKDSGQVSGVRFFPFDFSWNVRRFIKATNPLVYIGVETELWPNLFRELRRAGCPMFVLNGRISEKSFPKYKRFAKLFRLILRPITAFGMQSERDAQYMRQLVGGTDRVFVTGNIKFDKPAKKYSVSTLEQLRSNCGITADQKVIVFGSSHEGEEKLIIQIAKTLSRSDFIYVIVPRHPERFNSVWDDIKISGVAAYRVSSGEEVDGVKSTGRIVLVDKMGVLDQLYCIADISVVCGSFIPNVGGHNILEPAFHGCPVMYGQYMWGQPEMLEILNGHGGLECRDAGELCSKIEMLINSEELRKDAGLAAKNAVESNRGAVLRNMTLLSQYLKKGIC